MRGGARVGRVGGGRDAESIQRGVGVFCLQRSRAKPPNSVRLTLLAVISTAKTVILVLLYLLRRSCNINRRVESRTQNTGQKRNAPSSSAPCCRVHAGRTIETSATRQEHVRNTSGTRQEHAPCSVWRNWPSDPPDSTLGEYTTEGLILTFAFTQIRPLWV